MNIIVNGEKTEIDEGISIGDFLEQKKINKKSVACELNINIIPKVDYHKVILSENDRLEIVHFVGGG